MMSSRTQRQQPLLAFVHIEKAAGTTLLYLLRRNYLLRYLDVRPLRRASTEWFTAADLRSCLRLNPWLRCIGGHAVRPCADLETIAPDIRYVTLLREPVARYLSQYAYWVRSLRKDWSFERFLDHEPSHDFQTKKLVGSGSLADAKAVLAERFFLVGVAEQFDEFLVELCRKLRPQPFDPRYRRRNVGTGDDARAERFERYFDRIRANNARDLELYAYVSGTLLARQRSNLGGELAAAVAELRRSNASGEPGRARLLLDGMCRKLYYEPVTGLLRRLRGMPMKGSY
jgi:hypothetical protein